MDPALQRLAKRAIRMRVGGFRPPENPLASWFGRVTVAMPGESWPVTSGKPMHALCQLNIMELPFRPPRLDDIEFVAVFIGPDELPNHEPNGVKWCLRAYGRMASLVPLEQIDSNSPIKPFPMLSQVIEEDFPCWEDVHAELAKELGDRYYDLVEIHTGLKLGGWPSLVQGSIYWAPWNRHPAKPEYVFQIDTEDKAQWQWGDAGTAYFGRGTALGHQDEWTMDWQCY